jgi:hypothetical protein
VCKSRYSQLPRLQQKRKGCISFPLVVRLRKSSESSSNRESLMIVLHAWGSNYLTIAYSSPPLVISQCLHEPQDPRRENCSIILPCHVSSNTRRLMQCSQDMLPTVSFCHSPEEKEHNSLYCEEEQVETRNVVRVGAH